MVRVRPRTIDRRALISGQKSQPPLRRAAKYSCLFLLLLTFHGASFILHAHTNLKPDSEDIGRIITELPSKLQEIPTSESEKAPVMSPNAMSFLVS